MTRCLTLLTVMFLFSFARADDVAKKVEKTDVACHQLIEAHKHFEKMLTGATLVGHFTMSDKPSNNLSEERYTISKVTKVANKKDTWQFAVQIKYGKYDVDMPLDLEVQWAGDTPMITLTDFTIPALGTFSARVLFHRDRYAGTWQHGKVGGHLFGVIRRDEATVDQPNEEKSQ